jgi:hypothetical protein
LILSTYNSGTRVIDCRSPVLPIYKYTEKKYVDDLFENGTILINTFQNLQKLDEKKHGDSDEGSLSTGLIGFDTSRGDKIPNILQQETHLGIPPFAGIAEDSCVLKYSGTTTYRINGYVFRQHMKIILNRQKEVLTTTT